MASREYVLARIERIRIAHGPVDELRAAQRVLGNDVERDDQVVPHLAILEVQLCLIELERREVLDASEHLVLVDFDVAAGVFDVQVDLFPPDDQVAFVVDLQPVFVAELAHLLQVDVRRRVLAHVGARQVAAVEQREHVVDFALHVVVADAYVLPRGEHAKRGGDQAQRTRPLVHMVELAPLRLDYFDELVESRAESFAKPVLFVYVAESRKYVHFVEYVILLLFK